MSMFQRASLCLVLILGAVASPGCGELEDSYGRVYSKSLNGTGVFADLLQSRGHEVRVARRLNDELRDWADVIVRFAPQSGPPQKEEADWYSTWMNLKSGRRVVYIPNDYEATSDYWKHLLAGLPANAPARLKERLDEQLTELEKVKTRPKFTPAPKPVVKPPGGGLASPDEWFAVKTTSDPPTVCKKLEGSWAEGIDPENAKLTRHEALKVNEEAVLLRGDDEPLVMSWMIQNRSRVLVVANGSFLLNAPIAIPARRPLALRVVSWIGSDQSANEDEYAELTGREMPKHVAFVEGSYVLAEKVAQPSVFSLLMVPPFGWVVAQLLLIGLAASLARAPRLGRARPDEPTGADRPVAHPEALGSLLARTGQAREARLILETYRKWRTIPTGRGASKPI